MRLGDMTVAMWTLGLRFRKAPFALYIRLAGCMQLSSTTFKRERDTGWKLAENRASSRSHWRSRSTDIRVSQHSPTRVKIWHPSLYGEESHCWSKAILTLPVCVTLVFDLSVPKHRVTCCSQGQINLCFKFIGTLSLAQCADNQSNR